MLRFIVAFTAVILATSPSSAEPKEPYKPLADVAAFNAEIDRVGAEAVLRRLWTQGHGETFTEFLTKVESGDEAWIKVAERLNSAASDAASLLLAFAITVALPNSPEAVLDALASGDDLYRNPPAPSKFSLIETCSGSEFESEDDYLAWSKRVEQALLLMVRTLTVRSGMSA